MTLLRGPADADHYRIRVGRYGDRWYTDPLPTCPLADATDATWPSVSTIKKAGGADWTFVALKRVAAMTDPLDGLPYDERYERLKSTNKLGLDRAARRGTNVHRWIERGLYGHPIQQSLDDSDDGAEYLPAVRAFLHTYQPELVAAELVCIDRTLGYGGTCDAVVRIDGEAYVVDWKSRGADSDHGAYPEEAAQLGAYGGCEYVIVEDDDGPRRARFPEVAGGLIVSIKPDGVRLYPVDLAKARSHWESLHAWWTARRSERDAVGKPWAPRKNATVEAPSPPSAAPVGEGEVGEDAPPASPERRAWMVERIRALTPDGRSLLAARWPAGMPTLRQPGHTDADLDALAEIVTQVETDTEAPFPGPDPTKPVETPAAPEPAVPTSEPDEGPDVDDADYEAARKMHAALEPADRALVDAWAKAVHRDGGRSLSLRQRRSTWRWSLMVALCHVARATDNDDGVRTLLALAGRADAEQPGIPLGALLASLTTEEADALASVARGVNDGTLVPS